MKHFGAYHSLHQLQDPVSNVSPINSSASSGQAYPSSTPRTWERGVRDRSSLRVRPASTYNGIQPSNRNHTSGSSSHGHDQASVHGTYVPSVADVLHSRSTHYIRPQSSIELQSNLQGKGSMTCQSLNPRSSYVRASYSSPMRKPNLNRAPLSSYTRTLAAEGTRFIPTKLSAVTASLERAFKISRLPQIKIPELTGWRAKLAQEGLVSDDKTQAPPIPPARKWHYINETDSLHEEENNFVIVVCQATQTENGGKKHSQQSKPISRLRNMKLERLKPEVGIEMAVQVNSSDIQKRCEAQKLRSLKRNFIPSRYTGYYTGSLFNKYASAPHSKRRNYQQMFSNSGKTESAPALRGKNGVVRVENLKKGTRKGLALANSRNEEIQGPSQKYNEQQEESVETVLICSSGSSGEESSPIETGYESHSSDSSRSRLAFSESPNTCPESPFNSELCESELNISLNAEDDLSNPNSAEIQQDEQLFRFYSATEETSQRDSGFMDMVNYCESPYSNGINSEDESTLDENSSNFKIQNGMSDEFSNNVDSNDPTLTNRNESENDEFKEVEYELHEYSKLPLCHTWMETSNSSEKLSLAMMEHGQIVNQYQNIDEILEIGPYKSNGLQKDSALINNNQHQLHCSDYNRNTSNVKDVKDVSNLAHSDEFDNDIRFRNNIGPVDQIKGTSKLDDCTLQLYRYNSGGEGDYGSYLDLESTVDEQVEEFDGFHNNRKNAVILRTQLSVRVHAIIEKLVNSSGRELRRALFSLKQIFQDDKDLVHEFVQNDGLACLIKVGSEADQNYQNYILRALGQVMLYVDGMNGVIEHNETIQWLYSLIASKFRLVVKTALKLLLVFVEYTESNSQLLINAVTVIDRENGSLPWSNIMNLLKEKDSADVELLVYASTLINKTLNGVPDQDTYYDVVDTLEEQGMEYVVQYYMSKQGTDLDLLQQFHIYEAVLKHEDDIPDTKPLPLDARLRQVPRSRKSYPDESDRRKSRRHSVGTVSSSKQNNFLNRSLEKTSEDSPFIWHDRYRKNDESRRRAQSQSNVMQLNENLENNMNDNEVGTMALSLKRRRERDARNKSFIKEQEENGKDVVYQKINNVLSNTNNICSENCEKSPLVIEETIQPATERRRSSVENCVEVENRKNGEFSQIKDDKFVDDGSKHFSKLSESIRPQSLTQARSDNNKKAWMFSMMYAKSQEEDVKSSQYERISPDDNVNNKYRPFNKTVEEERVRDNSLKDVREKFNGHHEGSQSPVSDNFARLGDSSGIISRAKEGLAASTSIRSEPKYSAAVESTSSKVSSETKKVDSDLQWEQLMHSLKRPLIINDLDFTDLKEEEDTSFLPAPDYGSDSSENYSESCTTPLPSRTGPPPPPPPLPTCGNSVPAPPQAPPPSRVFVLVNNPQLPPPWIRRNQHDSQNILKDSKVSQKTKKTVKLFWREVKDDHSLLIKIGKKKTIWDELKPVTLDTQKLEHLFENRAKDIINKKSQDCTKKSELIVLDTKRSNAINIGMTKLPPPRTIKTAILKMDSTIMNREGIEKLLTTMLPTEDEKSRIAEAQMANPDIPLGTAEQFLLTLSSISELDARLKLWAFRLDYDSIEKEVAEPLMDLKQAMKEIEDSETFRVILSTLRSVGNFLNGAAIKGFHIEYLSKVPEVKDTVQKHSLLHHLCHIVMEKFPKSTDLYSEIGSVTRASKVDYSEVARNLNKMESECKASWDYLKAIAKHDCSVTMKVRISEFLADCAERIIVLKVIHRRMINRYHKFLLYLGCINQSIEEMPVQKVCKILSEFALEFRTTRERVLQQIEKKANHRERNKTRGKMITDMAKFRTKEQQADHELKQLLGNTNGDTVKWGTFPSLRGRKSVSGQSRSLGYNNINSKDEGLTDGDDEILETLVKTATAQPARNEPKIRKKARYGDRKSLRRTLKNGLSDDEKFVLSSMTT